jgi:hypothetical protein
MANWFKDFLKDKFLIIKVRNRFNASVQIGQRQLYHHYRELLKKKELPSIKETGFRVFSQFEEDGMLLFIFSVLGMDNKIFVEIGSDDGINSNSANLYFNFGWNGLFIDGNLKSIKRGERFFQKYPHTWFYKPSFVCAKVTPENINTLLKNSSVEGEVGFLSIDIDGNDYWIWDAIDAIKPIVVMIESHIEFGLENIVVPYDPDNVLTEKHPIYNGASPMAMKNLASRKGYRLVGANAMGFNLIFIKNGFADMDIPEVTVESVLNHPYAVQQHKLFQPIKDWDYIAG